MQKGPKGLTGQKEKLTNVFGEDTPSQLVKERDQSEVVPSDDVQRLLKKNKGNQTAILKRQKERLANESLPQPPTSLFKQLPKGALDKIRVRNRMHRECEN